MAELLAGKIALITGGAAGIGKGIAEQFAEHGAQVIVMDRDAGRLAAIKADFAKREIPLQAIAGDVLNTDDVIAAMQQVEQVHGRLDVLVNNVGDFLGISKALEDMSDDDIDSLLGINLRQVMVVTREAIPLMKRAGAGGSIIAVSSIEGHRAMPNMTPYAAAKAGLAGFARTLSLELGRYGIRVNVIAPETTESEQVKPEAWMAPEDYAQRAQWFPLQRFGTPSDTAGCAVFLASELSAWVTGTTVHCDGGALAAAGWYATADGAWTNTPVFERSGFPTPPAADVLRPGNDASD
ncbi:MAG: SDR family NAD(P)-dependent oxidoreductase [Pseudomonadota bacterium]